MHIDLPYLSSEKDRHGKPRLYARRHGRRIRLRGEPGTPAFLQAYSDAVRVLSQKAGARSKVSSSRAVRGTLGWLAALYFGSDEFGALDLQSQRTRRNIVEACLREPVKSGAREVMRDCPLAFVTAKKIKWLRDLKTGTPGAANNRRKWLSAMFSWAVEENLIARNPARDVRRLNYPSQGFHTWSIEEVRQFHARHPVGTKARLALSLLLFVGVRRGDLVELGRQHVRDGWIRFFPKKTRHRSAAAVEVPMIPELERVIAGSPCGDLTFLENDLGRGFTAAGFGNKFREWCDEAGLPHCSAHGLRKAGATIAAENGATEHQLMAMYGWATPAMAAAYTRAANRKRLAGQSMGLLAIGSDQIENKDCRTFSSATVAPK